VELLVYERDSLLLIRGKELLVVLLDELVVFLVDLGAPGRSAVLDMRAWCFGFGVCGGRRGAVCVGG
jgi:hypothetical protein